jgi:hypothetical protein
LHSSRLGRISRLVDPYEDLQPRTRGRDAAETAKHVLVSYSNGTEKASPWKMDVNFIRDVIEFGRKLFHRGVHEEDIRKTALRRFAMNLLGYLLEGFALHLYPDVELVGIVACASVDIPTVAGPYVHDHSPLR